MSDQSESFSLVFIRTADVRTRSWICSIISHSSGFEIVDRSMVTVFGKANKPHFATQ
jgi:hypothetical protein